MNAIFGFYVVTWLRSLWRRTTSCTRTWWETAGRTSCTSPSTSTSSCLSLNWKRWADQWTLSFLILIKLCNLSYFSHFWGGAFSIRNLVRYASEHFWNLLQLYEFYCIVDKWTPIMLSVFWIFFIVWPGSDRSECRPHGDGADQGQS